MLRDDRHEQQQRVAIGPGNMQFISIRRVSSDAATLRRGTCGTVVWSAAAAALLLQIRLAALGNLLIKN